MQLDWFDIVGMGVNRSEDQAALMLGISQLKEQSQIIATAPPTQEVPMTKLSRIGKTYIRVDVLRVGVRQNSLSPALAKAHSASTH